MASLQTLMPELRRQLEDLASRFMASDEGQRVIAWYEGLSPRDRLALRLLGWFVAVLALYFLLLRPVIGFGEHASARLQEERELVNWLRANQTVATQSSAAAAVSRDEPVAVLVNASAQEFRITIESIKPAGDNGIRIELKGVAFNDVVKWLYAMEEDGIYADGFTITPSGAGVVDASLTLRG